MERATMNFPFEVGFDQVLASIDGYVSVIFSSLESEFLILPKGQGFIEYAVFETGYEALKRATAGFTNITTETVLHAASESPITLIVLRAMLGLLHLNGRISLPSERVLSSGKVSRVHWIAGFGWLL
jgi:hypothetical protein